MLELKDFFHLPEVENLLDRLVADRPGLVVVAGLDARQVAPPFAAPVFLPSGRATIFGIIARRTMVQNADARAIVVAANRDVLRVPNAIRRRVRLPASPPEPYPQQFAAALAARPEMIVLDQLDAGTAAAVTEATAMGVHVLAQVDCVFRGSAAARHLYDLDPDLLAHLTWIVTVQRLPALCATCRRPAEVDAAQLAAIGARYSGLELNGPLFQAASDPTCPVCRGTGQNGELALFDFFRAAVGPPGAFRAPSVLPMDEYVLRLAAEGRLAWDDAAEFEAGQLRRTYALLTASERAERAANVELREKVTQLEAANRVLQQRTESLISLEGVARALIASSELRDLARLIAGHARELCGGDRSILYVLRPDMSGEVAAASGWNPAALPEVVDAAALLGARGAGISGDVSAFQGYPPGLTPQHPDVEGADLRAGLRVPLVAQHEVVGLMVIQSTRKDRFTAAETALLQAYADQAALAIQRAGLVESLRDKIARLEAAQVELVRKERLERELELARQVQQSILPRVFPEWPGLAFAARYAPARQVGGDFYDVFRVDDRRCGIVMADVSDKGMPAALFMALTRSLLLAEARRELSPKRVLERVHALLLELGDPQMFVTVFYGVLEVAERRLTYTRAGHERPLLLRSGMAQPLAGSGTFLGNLAPDIVMLTEEQMAMQPGDRLALYTDGLTDALAPDGQPYGAERLAALLATHAQLSPEQLVQTTFDDLAAYQSTADQFDDMALLVLGLDE